MNSDTATEPFFAKYLRLVPEEFAPISHLQEQQRDLHSFLSAVSEEESLQLHAPYTWTFRQVVNHLSDCERVFSFRLLWMARGQTEPMTSFAEARFSLLAQANEVSWQDLVKEFAVVRESTLTLIAGLPTEAWSRAGTAAGFAVDVATQCRIMFGHVEHHHRIMKQRLVA